MNIKDIKRRLIKDRILRRRKIIIPAIASLIIATIGIGIFNLNNRIVEVSSTGSNKLKAASTEITFKKITSNYYTAFAIDSSGKLWGWGKNYRNFGIYFK